MLKAKVNIQVLKVDRRLITLFKPFFRGKRFRAPKWAFCLENLVRIASYGPQIDQLHGENRLSHIINQIYLIQSLLYGFQTRPFAEVITWRLFDFRFVFVHILWFNCRYPYESKSEPIKVFQLYPNALAPLIQGLMASGFTLLPANPPVPRLFLPCPVGTFSNSSNQGTEGCTPCPAGIRLVIYMLFTGWEAVPEVLSTAPDRRPRAVLRRTRSCWWGARSIANQNKTLQHDF